MPQIVDTTIRLLSQEPLAGKLPTGEVLADRRDPRPGRLRLPRGLGWRRVRLGRAARRREPVGADPRDRRADDDAARPRAARPLPRRLAAGLGRHRAAVRLVRGRERDRRLPAPRSAERRLEPARGRRGDRGRGQGVPRRPRLQRRPRRRDRRARRAREADSRARRDARDPQRPDRRAAAPPHRGARRRGSARRPGCPSGSSSRAPRARGC